MTLDRTRPLRHLRSSYIGGFWGPKSSGHWNAPKSEGRKSEDEGRRGHSAGSCCILARTTIKLREGKKDEKMAVSQTTLLCLCAE